VCVAAHDSPDLGRNFISSTTLTSTPRPQHHDAFPLASRSSVLRPHRLCSSANSNPQIRRPAATFMVIARVASFFSSNSTSDLVDDGRKSSLPAEKRVELLPTPGVAPVVEMAEVDDEAARPPYLHVRASCTKSLQSRRLLTIGYRQCWLEESAAQPATCSCILSTLSRPGSRAIHTCHQSTLRWETHTTQSGGRKA
jgi:hypothetical protein